MNNIKKIGLTALAGSLVASSAMAAAVTASGSSSIGLTQVSGTQTTQSTNAPLGGNGWYGLLGAHFATISTSESLPASSYPDEDVTGYQVGFGQKSGNFKYELFYSDFEDINITASGGNSNSVSADADALTFRMSFGF